MLSPRHLIVKLGTQLLSDKDRRLDVSFIGSMAQQIAALRGAGHRVTIVSSGAVGAGLRELNLPARPKNLADLQAVAAIGQRVLMDTWAAAFARHKLPVAQLLLTREDIDHRARFLNLRNTIAAVHKLGAVPIINENDTVSTDEMVRITFGDNDLLAALVVQATEANLLILLTIVDGLLDAHGKPLRRIDDIDAAFALVRKEKSPAGKGGMDSKLQAARLVTRAGASLIVANGRTPDCLSKILAGEEIGTEFTPAASRAKGRLRWINSARPKGTLHIDSGAAKALTERGKSLLPAGIIRIEGEFAPGDILRIVGPNGDELARGLSNYSSADAALIRGKKSQEIGAILGPQSHDEIVHRDNLRIL